MNGCFIIFSKNGNFIKNDIFFYSYVGKKYACIRWYEGGKMSIYENIYIVSGKNEYFYRYEKNTEFKCKK